MGWEWSRRSTVLWLGYGLDNPGFEFLPLQGVRTGFGPTQPSIRLGAVAVSWGIRQLARETKQHFTLVLVFVAWCLGKRAVARRSSPILCRFGLGCFVLNVRFAYGAFCLQCVSPGSLHWLLRVLFWCVCKPVAYFDGVCRASGRTADGICRTGHLTALLQLAVPSSKACYSNTSVLRTTGLVSQSAGKETSFMYVLYRR